MASAIHLCYGPMPANHRRLASGTIGVASRPSRVRLGLSKPSHFLSNCSKIHQIARPVWRVNCMLENSSLPPKNEQNENKTVRGMTGISLVLACVLGVFSFQGMLNSKSATAYAVFRRPPSSPPQTLASIGQKKSKIDFERALDSWKMKSDFSRPEPSQGDIDELKLYALDLSKSGKPKAAFKILHNEYRMCKQKELSQEERFLNMALIELLIFQGRPQEAEERLDQLIIQTIADELTEKRKIELLQESNIQFAKSEIFLYKAAVQIMLKEEDAKGWWDAFIGDNAQFPSFNSPTSVNK